MDELITLVVQTYKEDEIGQPIPTEIRREIWARVESVTRAEFFSAGKNGLSPELVLNTPRVNYEGEKIALVQGVPYGIYRTYFHADSDEIELYLERKAGV